MQTQAEEIITQRLLFHTSAGDIMELLVVFKGIVNPKIQILSSFTLSNAVSEISVWMYIDIWFESYFVTIKKVYSIEYNLCSMNEISMYFISQR